MNIAKILFIALSMSLQPALAGKLESGEKKEQRLWTNNKFILSVIAGAGVVGALIALPYCKHRFGSFRDCVKQLGLGGAALPGANRNEIPQQAADQNPFDKIQIVQHLEHKPLLIKTQNLQEKLSQFLKDSLQKMNPEDLSTENFCSRRARKIRELWNSDNEKNMGAVYIIQEHTAVSSVRFGPHSWVYHVAAIYFVGNIEDEDGYANSVVLDSVFQTALTLEEWMERMNLNENHHRVFFAQPDKDYDVGFTAENYIPCVLVERI